MGNKALLIYWDTTSDDDGWAYRVRYADGHEESGPIDGLAAECADALRDGVKPSTGSWDAMLRECGADECTEIEFSPTAWAASVNIQRAP